MKKIVTLGAALLFCASLATAGGINLSYGDCAANSGTHTVTLTCANATAPFDLIGSVELDGPLTQFHSASAIIDFQSPTGVAIPNWWRFDGIGCRSGYATTAYNSTSGGACTALWFPAIQGGLSTLPVEQWQLGVNGTNTIRYNGVAAINGAIDLPQNDPVNSINEWGVVRVNITFNKTTGLGACAGCTNAMCVVFQETKITNAADPETPLDVTTAGSAGQYVAFNSYGGTCPSDTPAHNKTWGALKSLYR